MPYKFLCLRLPRALAAIALLCAIRPACAQSAADGLKALENNDNVKARAAFQAALHRNPADGEAMLGLARVDALEDRVTSAMKGWRDYYRVAPASWQAAIGWRRFAEGTLYTGQFALLADAARDVLAAKGAPAQLRDLARFAIARVDAIYGKQAEADAIWTQLGAVRRWRICGPFDNISRSGLDKPYPPETGMAFGAQCVGKDDLSIGWHNLGVVSRDGQCLVASALGNEDASVFYASTAAYSPAEASALLQLDTVGASRVWLNGRSVFADSIYRENLEFSCGLFRIPVRLRAGWNTIVVKLADEHEGSAAFRVRLTAPDGGAISGIRIDPAQAVAQRLETAPAASPAMPALAQMMQAHLDNVQGAAALAGYESATGDHQSAIDTVRRALASHTGCGWLHAELSDFLEADEQLDEARAERELARKANPRLVNSELGYLQEQHEALGPAEITKRLKALLAINPESARIHWDLFGSYYAAKMTQDGLREARLCVRYQPGPTMLRSLVSELRTADRKAEAQTALASALQSFPNDGGLWSERARILSEDGRIPAAIAAYEHLLSLDAPSPEYRSEIARLYTSSGDSKRAVQALTLLRQQRPQDAEACARLADGLASLGRKDQAVSLYREAIRLDPAEVTVRDKLQISAGERPIVDLAPATPAQPVLDEAKAAKAEGASATVFLDEAREVVYPDFATMIRFHQIIKVFDDAGVRRYQSYPLARDEATAHATVERARIIKPDGKIQDTTSSGGASENEDMASFPSLAPGDVIDISYRVENFRRGALSRQYWLAWFFSDITSAVRLSRLVLITPTNLTYQTKKHGNVPDPTVKDVNGWRIREWRMTGLPIAKPTQLSPGPLDTAIWLDISTVPSWRDIVRWYTDLARSRCEPDAATRAKAAELTKDAHTEEEKIRAIVRFVRAIPYQTTPFRLSAYVPTEPKQVLRERYADCKDKAALLTALLAAVGIRSRMVLLNPRNEGLAAYLPSPRFAHAIAAVETAQGQMWVDATADALGYGELPAPDQGVSALVVDDAGADLTPSPVLPFSHNAWEESYDFTLTDAGELRGSGVFEARGNPAWLFRSYFHAVSEQQRDQGIQAMVARIVANCRCEGIKIENLPDADAPFRISFNLHADHFASPAGSFLVMPVPWSGAIDGVSAALDAAGPGQDCEQALTVGINVGTIRVKLPKGYTVQELPSEAHGEDPWTGYKYSYRVEGDTLIARMERRVTAPRVPASGVSQYLSDLRASDAAAARQVVLKR
jgi:tetratricopeptide (TPR) repeat protein/transglutaminase-like putative cysteine protease